MHKKEYTREEIEAWNEISKFKYVLASEFTLEDGMMEVEPHAHDFGILTCVRKGIVKIATDSDSWVISHNTIFYLPPDIQHSMEMIGECQVMAVIIPNRLKKNLPPKVSILELSSLLFSILERMTTWGFKLEYSLEQQRLAKVAEDELKNAKEADYFHIPMPKDQNLKKLANAILVSPEDMSPIEHWAKFTGMSLRSFTRHFNKETGLAFTEWRQRVKIYTALKLLADNASVSDVSFGLGYQNVSTFIAMFKTHIGTSPAEFMKRSKSSVF